MYQEKFMDLDLYNETYDHICKTISKPGATLLEIGCGPGNITKYLLSKRPDFRILGTDIAPNMIELAKKNNPTAQFEVMDGRDIKQLQTTFDGIIGGFCLPYLSPDEGKKLIATAYEMLNENGLLYLSFVAGNPNQSEFKTGIGGRVYFFYHDLETLIKQLEKNFGKIKTFRIKYETSDSAFDIHTILIAQKS